MTECFVLKSLKKEHLERKLIPKAKMMNFNNGKIDSVGCAVVSPTTFKDRHEMDEKNEPNGNACR